MKLINVSISDDIRVVLLRLADRVDLMRNLDNDSREIQLRYADETFHLYAPLAHRLGLYALKTELEENAMRYSEPEMYYSIEHSLKESIKEREAYIKKFIAPIKDELKEQGFQVTIKGRSKSIYSIWKKMQKQNVDFEQVYDVFAIRIILDNTVVNEKADCWNVYSIITNTFEPNPKRLRDWITTPKKSTGYESLHTTVKGHNNKWIEVQIRTRRMDEVAETGQAAHWKYKEGKKTESNEERMKRIREILETEDALQLEKGDGTKIDLYKDTIFVFTPNADLYKMKAGSTVLDFAYRIHSNIGDTCIGAIIKGQNYSIKHKINNGDTIKILTSKKQSPSSAWLNIVTLNKTKAKIRKSIRAIEYKDAEMGKGMLLRKLGQLKIEFSDLIIQKLQKYFNCHLAIDLYQKIGSQQIDIGLIKNVLTEEEVVAEEKEIVNLPVEEQFLKRKSTGEIFFAGNDNITDYQFAKCCRPVFGDSIFGFVTVGGGVKIHRNACPNAQQLREKYPYRIVEANWYSKGEESTYLSQLRLVGVDRLGLVKEITDLVTNNLNVNIQSISFGTTKGEFIGDLKVFVKEYASLEMLIHELLKINGVNKVQKIK